MRASRPLAFLGKFDRVPRGIRSGFVDARGSAYSSAASALPVALQEIPEALPPLSIMPNSLLLRSYFVTSVLASPRILRICLPVMMRIANSQSRLLNPDRNPVLHFFVRKLMYEHFAAGENGSEVKKTITSMKQMGFRGVILGYAKEVSVTEDLALQMVSTTSEKSDPTDPIIQAYFQGTIKTLSLVGAGDFLAIKFSGGGPSVLEALAHNKPPPPDFLEGMHRVCEAAVKQNTRIWIDAEQQDIQGAIDAWSIDLMRNYNRDGKTVVYTTMQAYLKHTPDNILRHLKLAQAEDWALGIKLVRGAYIHTEERGLIHNTIDDTHKAYDTIVNNILTRSWPGVPSDKAYPRVQLFLASHNKDSINKAYATQTSLIQAGKPTVELEYGQLQGMADEVSCSLLQLCQTVQPAGSDVSKLSLAPKSFKCLAWGTTQELLQFLLRRLKENKDALSRTEHWVIGFRQEIWRRIKKFSYLS
ncbi:proline oxidase [Phlyctema vagabunda]|uniref:Proline dehydrogenase n=1 Tax=Phlyctema vagabunda TaxID=108571 RepID=A0ABR4P1Q9_9HELO